LDKKAIVNNVTEIYRGRVFNFVSEDVSLPNGRRTDLALLRHPGSTAIVPLLDDDTVVIERQYRHPVGRYMLEIPAGTMEPGETPLDCARRELTEETGMVAADFTALGLTHIVPSYCDEVIHLFIARGLSSSRQNLDSDEIIEVVRYPLPETMEMIADSRITDALTILCLQRVWFYLKK